VHYQQRIPIVRRRISNPKHVRLT